VALVDLAVRREKSLLAAFPESVVIADTVESVVLVLADIVGSAVPVDLRALVDILELADYLV
jgi:hypothetical protein